MGNQLEKECTECKANDIKSSTTRDGLCTTTLVMPVKSYNTLTNSWETSNPNTTTYTYKCQYGHTFKVTE